MSQNKKQFRKIRLILSNCVRIIEKKKLLQHTHTHSMKSSIRLCDKPNQIE